MTLVGVFVCKFLHIPVDDLAILVPGILGVYVAGNVSQSAVDQNRNPFRRRPQDFPPPVEQEK